MPPNIPLDPQGRVASAYFMWTDASGASQSFVPDQVLSEEWSGPATVTENPVESGPNIADNIKIGLRRCKLKIFATQEPIVANQWTGLAPDDGLLSIPSAPKQPPAKRTFVVPEWQNNLQARILVGTASGLLGGAVGGAIGGKAGSLVAAGGSLAGSLVGGALFAGKVVPTTIGTNAGLGPKASPAPVSAKGLTPNVQDDYVQLQIALLEGLRASGQTVDVYGTKTSCIGTTMGIGGMAIEGLTHVRAFEDGTGATITIDLKEIRVVSTTTVPAPAPTLPRAAAAVSKGNQQTFDMESDVQAQTAADAASPFAQGENAGEGDAAAVLQ